MLKICNKCRHPFEGRANRLYCSVTCKSAVNNERQLVKTKELVDTNKILRRNRRIVADLFNLFKSQPIEKEILKKVGLDANYSTGAGDDGICFYEYTINAIKNRANYFFISKSSQ